MANITPQAFEAISREDFSAYEEVRVSAVVNMFSRQVEELAGISREAHCGILQHYRALCEKWPDVRKLAPVAEVIKTPYVEALAAALEGLEALLRTPLHGPEAVRAIGIAKAARNRVEAALEAARKGE